MSNSVNPLVLFNRNHESSFAYVFSKLKQFDKALKNKNFISLEESGCQAEPVIINAETGSRNKQDLSNRIAELEIENSKLRIALGSNKSKEIMKELYQFYETLDTKLPFSRETSRSTHILDDSMLLEIERIRSRLKRAEDELAQNQMLLEKKCIELNQTQIMLSQKCLDFAKLRYSYQHLLNKMATEKAPDTNNNDLYIHDEEMKPFMKDVDNCHKELQI